jgi:chaperonin GroEL (HSP60 family)
VFFCSFLVLAAVSIANIVKSSLGPVGLDKMLVDEIGVSIYTWLLFVLVTASL